MTDGVLKAVVVPWKRFIEPSIESTPVFIVSEDDEIVEDDDSVEVVEVDTARTFADRDKACESGLLPDAREVDDELKDPKLPLMEVESVVELAVCIG